MSHYNHVTLPYGVLPSEVINVGTVLGPFFLAQCFNWALYGVFVLQCYIYYIRFPKDLTYIKVLVYTVLVLDSFFMGAITHAAWQVLVQSWGDINILHELPWTWAMVPVGSGVVSCIVQLFFVYRIWKLSRKWTMPIIISVVTLAQCAFAIVTGVIAVHNKTFHYIRDFLPGFWLVGSIIADILICATLVRILWQSQTGFKDTDGVVLRLIRLSVESAAVPVIAATIKLALIYSYEDNRHLVFCVLLGRLYSNSLLAMLNCRDPLFGGGSNPNTMAGASRLADGPTTVMSLIKSKFGFSSSNRGATTLDSRDQFSHNRSSFGGEKIMVQKSTTSYMDYDIELGQHDSALADRQSTYSLTSDEGDFFSKSSSSKPPVSPATAAAQGWMRPPSGITAGGPYDTTSELVTALPAADGRRVLIATPTPVLAASGGRRSNERPISNGSSVRSLKAGDIFSGPVGR